MSDVSFHSLVEEYLHRRRVQGTYSIEQFANEFPELRDEIIEEFPGLVIAESLRNHSNSSIALPKKIGRYVVGREIGRGGMGIVMSATNPDLDSEVAIKLLPFARMRSPEVLQRFRAEAKICAAIDHPNIVPVFDYGTDDNFAYLVMRKVKGLSLDKVIEHWIDNSDSHQLNWNFVTSIGIQAARAVHHAHEQGVIHRDLKPANLILEPDGKLWVSDFGLSKVINSETNLSMTGDVLGTPRYMAPEQLRGISNARSDVYSLGMTLYELVGLQPHAIQSENRYEAMSGDQSQPLPDLRTLNPHAPAALCEVIMQAIDLNPQQRFATAKELETALMQSVDGTFIGNRRKSDREVSRRQRIWMVSLASGVAAMVATIAYFLQPPEGKRLAKILEQPEALKQVLSREESIEAIAKQIPQLFESAVKTEDKELRAAFADFATSFFEPTAATELTDAQKAEARAQMKRFGDLYVESGVSSLENSSELKALRNVYALEGNSFLERIDRLKDESLASDFPEAWKTNAVHQLSRYQDALKNDVIFPIQQQRIENILVSLLTVEIDGRSELRPESLRYFISFLEVELNRAGETETAYEKVPYVVKVPPTKTISKKDALEAVEGILDDPRTEKLIDEASKDPRVLRLLDKLK